MDETNRWGLAAPLLLVLAGAAFLRFGNLGYSHFQGDEIKALLPADALISFLLSQMKGPGQFLVTGAVRTATGHYTELSTRLPFATASLTVVALSFLLVRRILGQGPALLAAALVGTCGLIIGLGRIVQYQSFCMLFVLLAAWAALRFAERGVPAFLYAATTAFACGLLFHYDALTFGPTLALLVGVGWRRHNSQARSLTLHVAGAMAVAAGIVGAFYVPYVLQPRFGEVADYLGERVAAGLGARTFLFTYELLSLYLPPFYFPILAPFFALGIVKLIDRRTVASLALVFWFSTVFAFYMLLGGDPRSHVYNFFLPGLVIVAEGMWCAIELFRQSAARRLARVAVWALLAGFGYTAWAMFVDSSIEHPWYRKTVLGYPLPNLETREMLGVFGFPYQRGLDTVGRMFDAGELRGTFGSNEREAMADYYFHSQRAEPPRYYFHVQQPLSLQRELPDYVQERYRLIRDVWVNGRKTIDIYEIRRP